ncbi:MAG: DJ-1/PfpI family protein [Nitrospinae bacterium]|nr:DJ-1/PfpI family protein [Nitrospinota bacterium]
MGRLAKKNILLIIPKDYYNEEELDPLVVIFKKEEATVKIASAKFKEAVGMRNGKVMPDMLIVDAMEGITGDSYVTSAKGTRQVLGVFHGVIIIGGRGTSRYVWTDKLVNLLLSDRLRSAMIVAGIGTGVPSLGKAGLLQSMEVTTCDDKKSLEALEEANAFVVDEDVVVHDRIITARDASAVEKFAEAMIEAVAQTQLK